MFTPVRTAAPRDHTTRERSAPRAWPPRQPDSSNSVNSIRLQNRHNSQCAPDHPRGPECWRSGVRKLADALNLRAKAEATGNARLIRGAYGEVFIRRVRSMGIRDRPTSPRSPWQNVYAERLIGSIRRECLDHVVVFGKRHLRRVLLSYMNYYNETRTHLSLDKDAPLSRTVQRAGRVLRLPILGGLHHQYIRI